MNHLRQSAFLQYVLSTTLLSFCLVTQEFSVTTDGGYSKLYGFPFPYISEMWLWTGHHDIFLANLGIDFAFYFCFWALIFWGLKKKNLIPHTTAVPKLILIGFLLWIILQLVLGENSYQWGYDYDFVINQRAIHFGSYYTRY